MTSKDGRQPVVFLSHGGGPSFDLSAEDFPILKGLDKDSNAADFLRNFVKHTKITSPKAVLVFSAHWEENVCSVSASSETKLLFDFSDFPDFTYHKNWSAPGAPHVAKWVIDLLNKNGVHCEENTTRGLDHGVFVPLELVFPKADVPVLQVSLLKKNADLSEEQIMEENLKIAESLRELSQDNILIIGSGFAIHNSIARLEPWAHEFRTWLHDVMTNESYSAAERKAKLLDYHKVPTYRKAHPTDEHFFPLAMACASSGYKPARILLSEFTAGSLLNDHYLFPTD